MFVRTRSHLHRPAVSHASGFEALSTQRPSGASSHWDTTAGESQDYTFMRRTKNPPPSFTQNSFSPISLLKSAGLASRKRLQRFEDARQHQFAAAPPATTLHWCRIPDQFHDHPTKQVNWSELEGPKPLNHHDIAMCGSSVMICKRGVAGQRDRIVLRVLSKGNFAEALGPLPQDNCMTLRQ